MATSAPHQHTAVVRITHWIAALCFLALLVTGFEIVISHPRFYWGEAGNVNTTPLFKIPIPASRNLVSTGYGFVLPDQNGWSRALHFQSAWFIAITGLIYFIAGFVSSHFRRNLIPSVTELAAIPATLRDHLRRGVSSTSYNPLQKLTYLIVLAILFPLIIWSGLAMSPAFVSILPATVTLLGGQQSARTIHFFLTLSLLAFLIVHVAMIAIAGFRTRTAAMIFGRSK